jgi:hypothetical protein
MFQVELVWNREFHFVTYGRLFMVLSDAIAFTEQLENSGDGERVKKTRIINESGDVAWAYGELIKQDR